MANPPQISNPLQTNNAALVAIGYISGIAATKFPFFDLATWNYIFVSIGGVVVTIFPLILNRKSAVISTVANMPEVSKIQLDKTIDNSANLNAVTPNNVELK
jgi:hypothetical protein